MNKETYTVDVYCQNCEIHAVVKVDKGISVAVWAKSNKCENCGCATLTAGKNW